MEDRNSQEFVAPTISEAVSQGLARLGCTREEIEITVLEEGRLPSGTNNGIPARVRLTRIGEAPPEDPELEEVRHIVQDLLDRMRLQGRTTARWIEPEDPRETAHMLVEIHGQDLGILVSRRGEVLSSMQYVARMIAGRRMNRPVPLILDVEGYRQRREQQLRRMARRAAEQAVERGRTVVLEPMPSNERRVIHLELRDHPGVTTESIGVGRQRKVTVIPKIPGKTDPSG
jgi:spoIIIJ-associated protein